MSRSTTRQRYLANGGSNPEILLRIADMEKQALDNATKKNERARKDKGDTLRCIF